MIMIRKIYIPLLLILTVIVFVFLYVRSSGQTSEVNDNLVQNSSQFDKSKYSLIEPGSIWVIVNKKYSLPLNYQPNLVIPDVPLRLDESKEQMQVSSAIESSLVEMFKSASADGVNLVLGSGYRSSALQEQFYDSYVARDGKEAADTYSARPGHSEHQTGLAVDITSPDGSCHLQLCFSETEQGLWLASNAHRFGFIIRYPDGKQSITGYQYEPWHIRFVSGELSSQINSSRQTLEEFFELGPAPSYD